MPFKFTIPRANVAQDSRLETGISSNKCFLGISVAGTLFCTE